MQNDLNHRTDKFYSRLIQREKRMKLPSRELSFFVTADCTLACDYCYLPGKNTNTRMPFEVAKKAVDYFVANSPKIFTEQRLILDFIGGEPLMEIDLMDQVIVGPDGAFYPCNRFIEYSLFNQKGRVIGNVDEGINFDKLRPFRVINLGNCSDAECIGCDVVV